MAIGTPERTETLLEVLESAFRPLTAQTTVGAENVELRILDGDKELLLEERPLFGTHAETLAREWIEQTRGQLEGMGYDLEPWQPGGERLAPETSKGWK